MSVLLSDEATEQDGLVSAGGPSLAELLNRFEPAPGEDPWEWDRDMPVEWIGEI